MTAHKTDTQQLVEAMYKNEAGIPIELSPGQDEIFRAIAMKQFSRVHCMCHTRFGKSLTCGLAVLTRCTTFPEKWAIIAGTKPKAKIIMDYVIDHIFDNDFTRDRFVPEKGESWEQIRRHRNKNRLTFRVGVDSSGKDLLSEVFIGSAKDALGFGAPNVVEDESALINDDEHSLVMRMLGDNPNHNFLVKIGNPFNRNHFLRSYHDPMYKNIFIDCYRSLREGRITQAVIDENRPYSFFSILYECKFPSASEIDESGWMYLVTDADIMTAKARKNERFGASKLGLDVARGGRNFNAWVQRWPNYARVLEKNHDDDPISIGDRTLNIMRENGIPASEVYVDDTGVGWGVTGYLKSKGAKVNAVNFGEAAEKTPDKLGNQKSDYLNVRAECYAGREGLQPWIKQVGQLEEHKDWIELTKIRYKKDSSGRVKIEPKEDMRKRGVESPDVADALALTFARTKKFVFNGVSPEQILAGGVKPFFDGLPG